MKKYGILSILFFLFSLIGAVFLVKNEQDYRKKAATGDKCTGGQEVCQQNKQGKNTGFLCKCLEILDPNDWQCTTQDLTKCPTESGGTDATSGTYKTGCTVNGVVVGTITGRCITALPGESLPQMWKYTCPGKMSVTTYGCQENEQVIPAGSSSVCFENNFCGSQQIDSDVWKDCFISVVDNVGCDIKPTTPPKTPTNTLTPTIKPTNTPTPTNAPTSTPTPGPSSTPTPTNAPTSTPTPGPTSTPVPTDVIVEGPSPTRIILPQSGVEFPSQMLTVFGGIITLLGFLILL